MKILKWVATAILLTGLTVSTAGAATALTDGGMFQDDNTLTGNGAALSDVYEFTLIEDLIAEAYINYTTGANTFANLTFTWSTGGSVVDIWNITDASGAELAVSPFLTTLLSAGSPYTLSVTGTVLDPSGRNLETDYSITMFATAVPIPAAFWLFGSALVGFIGFGRRRSVA